MRLLIVSLLISFLYGCNPLGEPVDIPEGFGISDDGNSLSSWDFKNASDYNYPSNYVEISSSSATLLTVDQTHSGTELNSGTHSGTYFDSLTNKITLYDKFHSSFSVDNIVSSKSGNLIGYWRMDNNWNDSSSFNNHGAGNDNATFSEDSYLGSASASLDGSRDAVNIGAAINEFNPNQGALSLWTKRSFTTVPSFFRYLFYFRADSDNNLNLIARSNGQLRLVYEENGNLHFSHAVKDWDELFPLNVWTHVVVTWDLSSNYIKLFVNGVETISIANTVALNGTLADMYIAYHGSSNQAWQGSVDDFALWNTFLSQTEIESIYNNQKIVYTELADSWTPHWNEIVGYWKMNGDWQDSSGNGNHATPNSNVSFTTGKVGSHAAAFSLSNSSGTLPNLSATLNGSTSFAINFWVSADSSLSNWDRLMEDTPGTGFSIVKTATSDQLRIGNWGVTASSVTCDACIDTDGSWFHHVITVYSGNYYWYVNGELKKTGSSVGGLSLPGATVIGGQNTASNIWSGKFDDFAIWRTGLSHVDVSLIYNRQKQKYSGEYISSVIDIGSAASWNFLETVTALPFAKELVVGSSESSTDYSSLTGDLSNGIIGYWSFNEASANSVSGDDFEDLSINNNHGVETGGVSFNQNGILKSAIELDGIDDYVSFGSVRDPASGPFSMFGWFNISDNNAANIRLLHITGGGGAMLSVDSDNDDSLNSTWGNNYSSLKMLYNQWVLVGVTWDNANFCLWLNGLKECSAGSSGVSVSGSLRIGHNLDYINGKADEFAVWDRSLSDSEIQQLYRRGGNRIKYQVKSCVDPACNCKSFNTAPVGNTNDCDGDGINNNLDTDDIYVANFIGPGGGGIISYSELFNRTAGNINYSCNTNTSDSNSSYCVNDEITFSGVSQSTAPSYNFNNMAPSASITNNRYFQYKILLEAQDNTACASIACLPEIQGISIGPTNRYYGGDPVVSSKNPLTYRSLGKISFDESGSCSLSYQLSSDGVTYYYFNGGSWTIAASESVALSSSASVISANITSFPVQSGSLYFKAFLNSDTTQSCAINSISVSNE